MRGPAGFFRAEIHIARRSGLLSSSRSDEAPSQAGPAHPRLPKLSAIEDLLQVVGIQCRTVTFDRDAVLIRVPLQHAQRPLAKQRHVLSVIPVLDATRILPEGHIQLPVQAILDPPMATQGPA